jgi:hypothetical protein
MYLRLWWVDANNRPRLDIPTTGAVSLDHILGVVRTRLCPARDRVRRYPLALGRLALHLGKARTTPRGKIVAAGQGGVRLASVT